MTFARLEKLTLLDYPGQLSALLYTYGCTMMCPFCHNPELLTGKGRDLEMLRDEEVLKFLETRVGKLDAVAITGGEPTLHISHSNKGKDLISFMTSVKQMGFKVKLDTYGLNPDIVSEILDMDIVDYWAMDVKGNAQLYLQCAYKGKSNPMDKVVRSVEMIKSRARDYEFRTTFVNSNRWHTPSIINEIVDIIRGAKNYYIQNFRHGKTLNPKMNYPKYSFSHSELEDIKSLFAPHVDFIGIRD